MYKGISNIKLKTFLNKEEHHYHPKKGNYTVCTPAIYAAAEFINRSDIDVIDIQFTAGSISIVYTSKE